VNGIHVIANIKCTKICTIQYVEPAANQTYTKRKIIKVMFIKDEKKWTSLKERHYTTKREQNFQKKKNPKGLGGTHG